MAKNLFVDILILVDSTGSNSFDQYPGSPVQLKFKELERE